MSRLLVVGFVVVIVVLGFNYYTEITRNAETSRNLNRLRLEFQEGSAARSEAIKKLELCRSDVAAARDVCKKRDNAVKKKDQMITDLTTQINESRKRENKLKEEIEARVPFRNTKENYSFKRYKLLQSLTLHNMNCSNKVPS